MKLFYHQDWRGNFGDDLNPVFFSQNVPGYEARLPGHELRGIGTLLNNVHGPIHHSVIFGAGFGYDGAVDVDWQTTHVIGVRGPITAKALGIDPVQYVIGDPAVYVGLMPALLGGTSLAGHDLPVVAIHHRTAELWDLRRCASDSLYFLDPGDTSIIDYIATIRSAPIVYTESLHGAIIAATFGVPFVPISIRNPLEKTKWTDFGQSVDIDLSAAITIPCLKIPQFRRYQVAAACRVRSKTLYGMIRYGVKPSDRELSTLVDGIKAIGRRGNTIKLVDKKRIAFLQGKIERGLDELRAL